MLTYGSLHFTDDTKAPTSGKRSVTHQTVTKPFSSLLSPKHGLLPWAFVASLSPSFISASGLEWALWLVNKFSDSGGGQLQPC